MKFNILQLLALAFITKGLFAGFNKFILVRTLEGETLDLPFYMIFLCIEIDSTLKVQCCSCKSIKLFV